MTWGVIGATGFVGSALVSALESRGHQVRRIAAPRLDLDPAVTTAKLLDIAGGSDLSLVRLRLVDAMEGCAVVVNAAGLAAPSAVDSPALWGANALLPAVVLLACKDAGVSRLIHVSSAAVQGRMDPLDESETMKPLRPYDRSKAAGEAALRTRGAEGLPSPAVCAFRATSVQDPDRRTTQQLVRFARSRFACVAGRGDRPVPVVTSADMADAIITLGTHPGHMPQIALQPWTGATTSSVLREFGGKEPMHMPMEIARALLALAWLCVRVTRGRCAALVRRVELLWMGQAQVPGWFESRRQQSA